MNEKKYAIQLTEAVDKLAAAAERPAQPHPISLTVQPLVQPVVQVYPVVPEAGMLLAVQSDLQRIQSSINLLAQQQPPLVLVQPAVNLEAGEVTVRATAEMDYSVGLLRWFAPLADRVAELLDLHRWPDAMRRFSFEITNTAQLMAATKLPQSEIDFCWNCALGFAAWQRHRRLTYGE